MSYIVERLRLNGSARNLEAADEIETRDGMILRQAETIGNLQDEIERLRALNETYAQNALTIEHQQAEIERLRAELKNERIVYTADVAHLQAKIDTLEAHNKAQASIIKQLHLTPYKEIPNL